MSAPTGLIELELKLALPPGQAERLRRHPALRPISPHRAVVAELDAIYFDTPDLALQAEGIAVRQRQAGGQWVQTVKTRGYGQGALHRRLEWETPSAGVHLDFRQIDPPAVRRLLEAPALARRLQPVFRTRFRRWARLLVLDDGTQVELALDLGEILAGEQSAPISEIELELKGGRAEALFEIALELQNGVSLLPEPRSKAERGYALHLGIQAHPARARAPALDPDQTPAVACAAFLGAALEQLQRNVPGACAGADPEFLHQARVALRRLRAALSVFRRALPAEGLAGIAAELRWLMSEVGPARDLDVFCTQTLPQVSDSFGGHPGLALLATAAGSRRAAAQQQACTALESQRATRLQLEVGRLACILTSADKASGTLARFARTALDKRARGATLSQDALAALDIPGRHDWRIKLKKLRYAGDFLLPVLDRPRLARRWIAALSSLQDILGALNDAASTEALLATLSTADPALVEARALVRGFLEGACQARMRDLERARRELERAPVPWKR